MGDAANRVSMKSFKDPTNLTRWVQWSIYAFFAAFAAVYISGILGYQKVLYDPYVGFFPDIATNDSATDIQTEFLRKFIAWAYTATIIVAVFLFLKWKYRAHINVRRLGATGLHYSPFEAILFYFVPLLQLWSPYRAMSQIWQASADPDNWRAQRVSPLVGWWWFFWIVAWLLAYAVALLLSGPVIAADRTSAVALAAITDVTTILTAFTMLQILPKVRDMQIARYRERL